MSEIESKIRKIVRGILVEGSCPCEGCQEIITQRILALIAADRAEHDKHFDWVAEHLTRLRINMTGDWMEIEYLTNGGEPKEAHCKDEEGEESYPEMLHKLIDSAMKGEVK
jgi:hypothetical protein